MRDEQDKSPGFLETVDGNQRKTELPPDGLLILLANLDQKGGLQNRYRSLARNLSATRPVTIITWRVRGRVPRAPVGVRVIRVPSLVPFHREAPPWLGTLNVAVAVTSAVVAALWNRRRWSAILAGGLNPEGLAAAILGRLLRRPFVLDSWLPGPLGNVARLERSKFARLLKRLLSAATALTPGTEEVAREMAEAGFPSAQIRLVRKGADLERWTPAAASERLEARRLLGVAPEVRVLAFWGRIDLQQKRIDLLLDAWELSDVSGCELLIVGDGPDKAKIEQRAETIEAPVGVLGWQEDASLIGRCADVFVLPTNFEETGIALLEGLASGLPGLVSKTPMYERMQPPGVVLVENNLEDWVAAIRSITSADKAEYRRLGAEGRSWAVSYGSSKELAATFEELLFPAEPEPAGSVATQGDNR